MTFDEAAALVETRMDRLGAPGEPISLSHYAPMLCIGTDVPGPALAQQVREDAIQMIGVLQQTGEVAGTLNGFLIRTFWLGYEFGRSEEQ